MAAKLRPMKEYDRDQWEGEDSWLDPKPCAECGRNPDFCECDDDIAGDEPPEHEELGEPVLDEHSPYL